MLITANDIAELPGVAGPRSSHKLMQEHGFPKPIGLGNGGSLGFAEVYTWIDEQKVNAIGGGVKVYRTRGIRDTGSEVGLKRVGLFSSSART